MIDPANKNLHRAMSEQWARDMKPRRAKPWPTLVKGVALIAGLMLAGYCIGTAYGRGVADAEVSIEIGPEGME